ncbi:MAG: NUDIX hydrolase [Candidatus Pacebacteria bacterium]|nr:NUDIX hydrolase [Candidatus Paceibacterota bacterium]
MNKEAVTASCAFVFDDNYNILAIKNHRGWDIPGGKVEQDESPDNTVIREVFEEASVIVGNANLFHVQEFPSLGWKIAYYRCDVIEVQTFKKEFETTHRKFMSVQDFLGVYGGEDLKETEDLIKKALKL